MSAQGRLPETRRAMERAIRRLNVVEYVLLGGAALMALLGGAAVAWILGMAAGAPFHVSWLVASLLLFVIPGVIVLGREARAGRPGAPTSGVLPTNASETRTDEADG